MTLPTIIVLTVMLSACGTWAVRQYALAKNVLDRPNDRSSHTRPTPRGGGAAIVLAMLLAVLAFWSRGELAGRVAVAVIGAGSAVAMIGFLDDHRPVSARIRLGVHFVAAAWALYFLRLPAVWSVVTHDVVPAWLGYLCALISLVWMLNLYNFMDGIDGLAASEAAVACFAASTIAVAGSSEHLPLLTVTLGAAASGFLLLNFPPASIFMGDVGSGFVGLMIGVCGLAEFGTSPKDLAAWLILLAVFISDATMTLFRRWRGGSAVSTAHRTHAYQHAARMWGSHRTVTLIVITVNLLWLAPLAGFVQRGVLSPFAGLVLAFTPIAIAVWCMRAGISDAPDTSYT